LLCVLDSVFSIFLTGIAANVPDAGPVLLVSDEMGIAIMVQLQESDPAV